MGKNFPLKKSWRRGGGIEKNIGKTRKLDFFNAKFEKMKFFQMTESKCVEICPKNFSGLIFKR